VPAVKADILIMDYSKMGAIIHMFMLANRAVTCASPSKEQHIAHNLFQGISWGQLIDQLDNGSILEVWAACLPKIEGSLKLP